MFENTEPPHEASPAQAPAKLLSEMTYAELRAEAAQAVPGVPVPSYSAPNLDWARWFLLASINFAKMEQPDRSLAEARRVGASNLLEQCRGSRWLTDQDVATVLAEVGIDPAELH